MAVPDLARGNAADPPAVTRFGLIYVVEPADGRAWTYPNG
jgi:hypothetical protein